MSEPVETPAPGSTEAILTGCTCPDFENNHGEGYLGQPGIYILTPDCPVHAPPIPGMEADNDNP